MEYEDFVILKLEDLYVFENIIFLCFYMEYINKIWYKIKKKYFNSYDNNDWFIIYFENVNIININFWWKIINFYRFD